MMKKKILISSALAVLLIFGIIAAILLFEKKEKIEKKPEKTSTEIEAIIQKEKEVKVPLIPDMDWYKSNPDKTEYIITTKAEFLGFLRLQARGSASVSFAGKTVKLDEDITINEGDMSEWDYESESLINISDYQTVKPSSVGVAFQGTFDGQGHTISGVFCEAYNANGAGIFLYTGKGAVIKNVKVVNSYIEGTRWAGGLVGHVGGKITVAGVNVQATITAQNGEAGGFAGDLSNSALIRNSTFDCNVSAIQNPDDRGGSGGIVGSCFFASPRTLTLQNVSVFGKISGPASGGIVGVVRNISEAWNLNLQNIALGAIIEGGTDGIIVGAMQQGDNKKSDIYNDFKNVYVLQNNLPVAGEKSLNFINKTSLITKSLNEMKKLVSGVDGYDGKLCVAEKLTPDTSWYLNNKNENEYVLKTREQFLGLIYLANNGKNSVNFKGKIIKLGADISFNTTNASTWNVSDETLINLADYQPEKAMTSDMKNGREDGRFSGTFDGAGHTLSGICIYREDLAQGAGLFLYSGQNVVIKNVNITNSHMECTGRFSGGIFGQIGGSTTVDNVRVNATVKAWKGEAGGLTGDASNSVKVTNSVFDCKVLNPYNTEDRCGAGGLIGSVFYTGAKKTLTASNIQILGTVNGVQAGGIVGVVRNISKEWNLNLISVAVGNDVNGETSGKLIGAYQNGENAKTIVTDRLNGVYTLENGMKDLGESTIIFENKGESETKTLSEMKSLVSTKNVEKPVADIRWYKEDENEFILNTKEEFLGFISLINNGKDSINFLGKTVKLGADVTINEITISQDNTASAAVINLSDYQSGKPIAGTMFQGTFDGQGHTVSGVNIYSEAASKGAGIFLYTGAGAIIKNVRLVNTYAECTGRFAGGVVAQVGGAISVDDVIVNATVVAGNGEAGGFAGDVSNNVTIKNSVFTCDVVSSANPEDRGGAGGIIGSIFLASPKTLNISNVRIGGTVKGIQAGGIVGVVRNISKEWDFTISEVAVGTTISGETCGRLLGAYQTGNNANSVVTDTLTAVYTLESTLKDVGEKTIIFKNGTNSITKNLSEMNDLVTGEPAISVVADVSWYEEHKEQEEYVLNTKEEFLGFISLINNGIDSVDFAGKTVKLGADIILNSGKSTDWIPGSARLLNVADYQKGKPNADLAFKGTFDGQGHTITGAYIYNDTMPAKGAGLFLYTGANAEIKNLKVENEYVASVEKNGRYAGGLIGQIGNKITVENVYIEATVKAGTGEAGGLAGDMSNNTTVKNSTFICMVETADNTSDDRGGAGGLVGTVLGNRTLTLENVRVEGSVRAKQAGGLIGVLRNNATAVGMKLTRVGIDVNNQSDSNNTIYGNLVGGFQIGTNQKSTIVEDFTNVYVVEHEEALFGENCIRPGNGAVKNVDDESKIPDSITGSSYMDDIAQSTPLQLDADISWYDSQSTAKKFEITTVNQFLGFLKLLTNSNGSSFTTAQTFEGWTITLGKDIVINDVNVPATVLEGNTSKLFNVKAVQYAKPGGIGNSFKGIFDGKGHSISGVYIDNSVTNDGYAALIPSTHDGAKIKNIRIINSYIKGQRYVSALVGQHLGGQLTVENVYTEADIATTVWSGGGLVGEMNANVSVINSTINNHTSSTRTGTSTKNSVGGVVGTVAANNCVLQLEDVSVLGSVSNAGKTAGGIVGLIREDKKQFTLKCNNVGVGAKISATHYPGRLIGSNVYGWSSGKTCTITNTFKNLFVLSSGNDLGFAEGLKFSNTSYTTTTKSAGQIGTLAGILTDWYNGDLNSYTINSKADFLGFQLLIMNGVTFEGKTIKLGADLVFNEGKPENWKNKTRLNNLADYYVRGKSFQGTFDGAGHTISGIYAANPNTSGTMGAGLFLETGAGAVIKNLKLKDSLFEGYRYTGSIVGQHSGTAGVTIENVKVKDVIVKTTNAEAGGLIGSANGKITVKNSTVNTDVTCTTTGGVGGLVGRLMVSAADGRELNIENVKIYGTVNGERRVGGIVGSVRNEWGPNNNTSAFDWKLTLKNVFMAAKLTATEEGTDQIGALIGGVSKVVSTHVLNVQNNFENIFILKNTSFNTSVNAIGNQAYVTLKNVGNIVGITSTTELPPFGYYEKRTLTRYLKLYLIDYCFNSNT